MHPEIRVRVPETLGCLKEGNNSYVMESLAKGVRFSSLLNRPGYTQDFARVEKDFAQAVKLIVEVSRVLQEIPDIPAIPSDWYPLANELVKDEAWANRIRRLRYFSDSGPLGKTSWIQHGDLWPEHLFLDQETGMAEIIDWDDLAAGFPPLYDIFSFLLYSRLLNASTQCLSSVMSHERLQMAFSDAFLNDGPVARLFGKLLMGACEQAQLDPKLIPSFLTEFLLMRARRYACYDQPIESELHLKLLRIYMDHFSLDPRKRGLRLICIPTPRRHGLAEDIPNLETFHPGQIFFPRTRSRFTDKSFRFLEHRGILLSVLTSNRDGSAPTLPQFIRGVGLDRHLNLFVCPG